jgi:hypothetical protein
MSTAAGTGKRIGTQLRAPMRDQAPVANQYTAPENMLVAVIVARRVIVVAPIRVIAVVVIGGRRIIRGIRSRIIITGVIRRHVRPLCTSAQKSCDDACAEQREQKRSLAMFCYCFHQINTLSFPSDFLFFGGTALISSADSRCGKRRSR